MKKTFMLAVVFFLAVCLVACGTKTPVSSEGESSRNDSTAVAEQNNPEADKGTAIILNMNGTDVHANLYDNTAARAFRDLLPYTVTVSRATDDLCGSVSEELPTDPAEDQETWKIGEIGCFDGWFTILCDNEEEMPKRTRTIIGKITDEDIPFMQSLTGTVKITVTLDESAN